MVLGAFGAGPKAIERRNHTLEALEQSIRVSRDGAAAAAGPQEARADDRGREHRRRRRAAMTSRSR